MPKEARFISRFSATQHDKRTWVLEKALVLNDDVEGLITVPVSFKTDLASISALRYCLPLLYALLVGYGNAACTTHDFLYTTGYVSRKNADGVLYRALRAEGVARWRAWLFYAGVRCFGKKFYKNN